MSERHWLLFYDRNAELWTIDLVHGADRITAATDPDLTTASMILRGLKSWTQLKAQERT
jgi:hypothetical protein